jgi:hypothetical protein
MKEYVQKRRKLKVVINLSKVSGVFLNHLLYFCKILYIFHIPCFNHFRNTRVKCTSLLMIYFNDAFLTDILRSLMRPFQGDIIPRIQK